MWMSHFWNKTCCSALPPAVFYAWEVKLATSFASAWRLVWKWGNYWPCTDEDDVWGESFCSWLMRFLASWKLSHGSCHMIKSLSVAQPGHVAQRSTGSLLTFPSVCSSLQLLRMPTHCSLGAYFKLVLVVGLLNEQHSLEMSRWGFKKREKDHRLQLNVIGAVEGEGVWWQLAASNFLPESWDYRQTLCEYTQLWASEV